MNVHFSIKSAIFTLISTVARYAINYFPHIGLISIKRVGLALLSPLLGKKLAANMLKNRICKRLEYSGG